MTLLEIHTAIETRLQALTAERSVAWEGVAFTPKRGVPYITARITGRNRTPMGVGPNTPHLWQGSFTVVVVHPAEEGLKRALRRAVVVLDHFPRGLTLPAGDGKVLIEAGTIEPAYPQPEQLNVPVVLRWFSEEV